MPSTATFSKSTSKLTVASLEKNQSLAWKSRHGARLTVHRGMVWVTASNCLDDHFVEAGQCLVLPAHSRAVVSGETASAVSIERMRQDFVALASFRRLLQVLLLIRWRRALANPDAAAAQA